MTAYEFPLTPQAQRFSIELAGKQYQMRFAWNSALGSWTFDLLGAGGLPLIQGAPLVTGADLFAQYRHLELGGSMVVQTDYDLNAVPTYENLGVTGRVYFLVE